MKVEYRNEFGYLRIAQVSGLLPISEITSENEDVITHKFSLEVAEQIALITGNKDVQIGVLNEEFCYLVRQTATTPDKGMVFRIDYISFNSDEVPSDALNRLNQG